ncbi:unnamed protein product [marine sediment metagenome]|uniref:Uncharacterized protein n=1 Tax=marine sediment metagenome TaxID=412755 RepID=X1V1D6_9ZZZZ
MLVKCLKCGYIMKIPSRYYPPKGIAREAKHKRDRLYDHQTQEFSLAAAQYHRR